jgi:hypothetical protein
MRSGEKIQKRGQNAKSLRSKETVAVCRGTKSPLARFRNWRRGGRFRRRGRRRYVLFDQVPKHCREQDRHQLRAPVFQGQSGAQDGKQLRAPVFRDRSLHSCCATEFPRCVDETSPEEIALNSPPMANGNAASLFRDDHRYRAQKMGRVSTFDISHAAYGF